MNQQQKKSVWSSLLANAPIIIGTVLPLIFVGILAFVVYLPAQTIALSHDFVFTDEGDMYYSPYKSTYVLNDAGTLEVKKNPEQQDTYYKNSPLVKDVPKLYKYDHVLKTTTTIQPEDLKDVVLFSGAISPDGILVGYKYGGYGLFGELSGGSNASGYYMQKDSYSKQLEGVQFETMFQTSNIRVIGWVK